jgi:hypothetical protein
MVNVQTLRRQKQTRMVYFGGQVFEKLKTVQKSPLLNDATLLAVPLAIDLRGSHLPGEFVPP